MSKFLVVNPEISCLVTSLVRGEMASPNRILVESHTFCRASIWPPEDSKMRLYSASLTPSELFSIASAIIANVASPSVGSRPSANAALVWNIPNIFLLNHAFSSSVNESSTACSSSVKFPRPVNVPFSSTTLDLKLLYTSSTCSFGALLAVVIPVGFIARAKIAEIPEPACVPLRPDLPMITIADKTSDNGTSYPAAILPDILSEFMTSVTSIGAIFAALVIWSNISPHSDGFLWNCAPICTPYATASSIDRPLPPANFIIVDSTSVLRISSSEIPARTSASCA